MATEVPASEIASAVRYAFAIFDMRISLQIAALNDNDWRGRQFRAREPRRKLGEINDPGFSTFRAERQQCAIGTPGQRGHRSVTGFLRQNFGAVLDTDQEHHAVVITR